MLTWSKPNAIVPDEPSRWILTTLRFYAIVASVGIGLAVVVISILAVWPSVWHHKSITHPIAAGIGAMVVLIVMFILGAAAIYFTDSLSRGAGYISAVFVIVLAGLLVLGLAFG